MLDTVIVRINEQLIPEFLITYNAKNSSARRIEISSWSDIKNYSYQEFILILSGVLVFSKKVKIPSKNEDVIKQSLPFTVEENLSTEIEANHFAYNQAGENLFNVCVVEKKVMQEINDNLEKNQLVCKKMYSEIFCLPASPQVLSVLSLDNYFVVNKNNRGTTLGAGLINQYIARTNAKLVHVYTDKPLKLENENVEFKQVNTESFQAQVLLNNKLINLFQGVFDKEINKNYQIKPWRKSIAIAVVLLLSWLGISLGQLWSLNQNINDIKNKQHDLLIKIIPDASQSEKNDPYSAIQSRLKYTQANKNSNNNGFIQSLIFVGQALKQFPKVKIVSIRQRENKMEIKTLAPDVSLLNQFQASLEQIALARHVKTGTRESTKEGISSVITMEKL